MNFDYLEPESLESAVQEMDRLRKEQVPAQYLAGGTDLFALLKRNVIPAEAVINLKNIPGLDEIREEENYLSIGPLVSLREIAHSEIVQTYAPALAGAADRAATPALRTMGTIGGNLMQSGRCPYYNQSDTFRQGVEACYARGGSCCHKDPESSRCIRILMSELIVPLLVEETVLVIAGTDGIREVTLDELVSSRIWRLKTKPSDIICEIRVAKKEEQAEEIYQRMAARKSIDYPGVNSAVSILFDEDGRIRDARLAVGSVGSGPFLIPKFGKMLAGHHLSQDLINDVCQMCESVCAKKAVASLEFPIWYRMEIVKKMVRDALTALIREAVA